MVNYTVKRKKIADVFKIIISIALMIVLGTACKSTTTNLEIEDAKKTIITLNTAKTTPPPRKIDDIMSVLNDPYNRSKDNILKIKKRTDIEPLPNMSYFDLSIFYAKRARARHYLSRLKQSREDLRLAVKNVKLAGIEDSRLLEELAEAEMKAGNFKVAIDLLQEAIKIEKPLKVLDFNALYYWHLARIHQNMGNFSTAAKLKEKADQIYNIQPEIVKMTQPKFQMSKILTDAEFLELQGKFSEAEIFKHMYLNEAHKNRQKRPLEAVRARRFLATNLKEQGELIEAEYHARKAVTEAVRLSGKNSNFTASSLGAFGEILLAQGRINDAQLISTARISILDNLGVLRNEDTMVQARVFAGDVRFAKFRFSDALLEYDKAYDGSHDNPYFFKKYVSQNPNIIIAYLKNNKTKKAEELIQSARSIYDPFFITENYKSAEILAIHGLIHAANGNNEKAIEFYNQAVPVLIKQKKYGAKDLAKESRFRIIIEDYMELLNRLKGTDLERKFQIKPVEEVFKLAQAIIRNKVGAAIDENSARAAATQYSGLLDLTRKEQSATQQIQALKEMLSNVIAAPKSQQNPKALESLKHKINALDNARNVVLNEINRRFPKYSNLKNPELAPLSLIQDLLNSKEALLFIYGGRNKTYVWAIPSQGRVQFSKLELTSNNIKEIVSKLRKALDPEPHTLGDIPKFDLNLSFDLYTRIFQPVAAGWIGSDDLIIITSGPLSQLPFSVLPTAPIVHATEKEILFSNYRHVPWLIRTASLTRLPSVSAFTSLRVIPEGSADRKPFVGFGDPLFDIERSTIELSRKDKRVEKPGDQNVPIFARGIRVTKNGYLDEAQISSCKLQDLNRLPDTAEEIVGIAMTMGADLEQDVFLGERASESRIKNMNLSDRRVIAFASHGLVPGDLDGLDQPAIALSSPLVTGETEDGLLTMSEIMTLNLDADWIVLSACNTGAADGTGAEAISGLGRAFFYSGTRAILVSMWSVETTSAKLITTGLFRSQKENSTLSRARALRSSVLKMIDNEHLKEKETGRIIASYAHPLFWAPFIIVGDGR
jgi:CHAT domain-containing protein